MITSGSALLFAQLRLSFYRLNSHAQHISTKISGTAGSFKQIALRIRTKKNANPPLLLWPSTRIFKADEAVKQHHLQSRQVVQQTNCRAAPIFRTQCGRVKRAFPSSALIQPERVSI
jgi:hypothetical protein